MPLPRLPLRTRALSWWAGVGQPVWRRWARRIDMLVLLVTPLLLMGALRLTITQDSPAPAAGSCTLVGSTWSCTGLPSARAPPRALLGGDDRQPVGGPGRGEVISGRGP